MENEEHNFEMPEQENSKSYDYDISRTISGIVDSKGVPILFFDMDKFNAIQNGGDKYNHTYYKQSKTSAFKQQKIGEKNRSRMNGFC